jgi:hypothetical protein
MTCFSRDCFWHSWDCKGVESSAGCQIIRTYILAEFNLAMGFTIWVNIMQIFWQESNGLSTYNTLNTPGAHIF